MADTLTAPTGIEVADVLDKAADVIDTNGHCKRYLYDTRQAAAGTPINECRACLLGALNIAISGSPVYLGTREYSRLAVAAEKALLTRVDVPSLVTWNDTRGRTKQQVTELCRDTAASLRGEAS